MNKSELKEVAKILVYHDMGLGIDYVARALSAMIRAARTNKSKYELHQIAIAKGANVHPEYIC
jgi:hypothetical protein